jgi:hypothetical protein
VSGNGGARRPIRRPMRRLVRRLHSDDAGLTLVELIIALGLTAVVATMIVSFFTTVTSSFMGDGLSTNNTSAASTGMKELSRVIRSSTNLPVQNTTVPAPAFLVAGASTITIDAYVDTTSAALAPVRVQFTVGPTGDLTETRWASTVIAPGYFGFSAAVLSQRVVSRHIVTTAAMPPVFSYSDVTGAAIVIPASGVLTAAQALTVAAVQIQLTVQADPLAQVAPVSLQNTVGLPNLGVTRVGVGS